MCIWIELQILYMSVSRTYARSDCIKPYTYLNLYYVKNIHIQLISVFVKASYMATSAAISLYLEYLDWKPNLVLFESRANHIVFWTTLTRKILDISFTPIVIMYYSFMFVIAITQHFSNNCFSLKQNILDISFNIYSWWGW